MKLVIGYSVNDMMIISPQVHVKQINKFEDFASSADETEVDLSGLSFDVDLDTLIRELLNAARISDKLIQMSDI